MPDSLTFPYPGAPPPSPFLGGVAGGRRSYEHIQTGVRADIEDGILRTPLPRAAFHGEELASALGLGDDFRLAFAQANDGMRPSRRSSTEATGFATLDPLLGLAWWRFTCARADLRRGWPAADIVVPDLLLLARRSDGVTTTVLVWPDDLRALVIPDAAEHIIVKSDPARGRPAPPSALISRAVALEVAGERAVPFAIPVPHHLYRGGASHPAVIAGLRSASGAPASAFRAVRPDQVLDSATG